MRAPTWHGPCVHATTMPVWPHHHVGTVLAISKSHACPRWHGPCLPSKIYATLPACHVGMLLAISKQRASVLVLAGWHGSCLPVWGRMRMRIVIITAGRPSIGPMHPFRVPSSQRGGGAPTKSKFFTKSRGARSTPQIFYKKFCRRSSVAFIPHCLTDLPVF